MNKKDYQTPTTKVVKLQHTGMLMTSTQERSVGTQDYTNHDYYEE